MVVSVDRWPLCGGAIVGLMYWMVTLKGGLCRQVAFMWRCYSWVDVLDGCLNGGLCRQVAFMWRCYSWVDVLDGSLAVTQDRLFLSEVVFNCISAFA